MHTHTRAACIMARGVVQSRIESSPERMKVGRGGRRERGGREGKKGGERKQGVRKGWRKETDRRDRKEHELCVRERRERREGRCAHEWTEKGQISRRGDGEAEVNQRAHMHTRKRAHTRA
jgi:hypothetical protein